MLPAEGRYNTSSRMKILTRNKIVEAFHFPFTEALVFSILVWTSWGLAEAFYWNRLAGVLAGHDRLADSFIYLQAFLIYVGIAAFWAILLYVGIRILLASFHLHNTKTFRAWSLTSILAVFFIATLFYCLTSQVWQRSVSQSTRLIVMGGFILFAVAMMVLLYRWSSSEDFRIRRSGTMMLSILVISVVLSFVPFPLFSESTDSQQGKSTQSGYRQLMAYHYLEPLLRP